MNREHQMATFVRQSQHLMAGDYERIRTRAAEDPGTAGDEGELIWKELFEGWLPPDFRVETKGRILFPSGEASPQVDVVVLQPWYPKQMLRTKYFISAGVIAAFECKLTLRAHHITAAVKTCAAIRRLVRDETIRDTPYKQLVSPLIYGLLAVSHDWKGAESNPVVNIERKLREADGEHVAHPLEMLDLLTVADLATWTAFKNVVGSQDVFSPVGPSLFQQGLLDQSRSSLQQELSDEALTTFRLQLLNKSLATFGPNGTVHTSYQINVAPQCGMLRGERPIEILKHDHRPIAAMLANLFARLAWRRPELRPLVSYIERVPDLQGGSDGLSRRWNSDVFEGDCRKAVEGMRGLPTNDRYDEWEPWFNGW